MLEWASNEINSTNGVHREAFNRLTMWHVKSRFMVP